MLEPWNSWWGMGNSIIIVSHSYICFI
jgi:hypothetical protein